MHPCRPESLAGVISAAMQRQPEAERKLAWDDVRLFLALGRARTLRGAAEALGVDASNVSRRLAALEEALSATLFERGREGIAPTEAAERLMPVAEELEEGMARFAIEAERLERSLTGSSASRALPTWPRWRSRRWSPSCMSAIPPRMSRSSRARPCSI
jgi:DNA-binding transcriptional LysR family regulator